MWHLKLARSTLSSSYAYSLWPALTIDLHVHLEIQPPAYYLALDCYPKTPDHGEIAIADIKSSCSILISPSLPGTNSEAEESEREVREARGRETRKVTDCCQ
jgi:hypothetical protein